MNGAMTYRPKSGCCAWRSRDGCPVVSAQVYRGLYQIVVEEPGIDRWAEIHGRTEGVALLCRTIGADLGLAAKIAGQIP